MSSSNFTNQEKTMAMTTEAVQIKAPSLAAIKAKQKAVWDDGDYAGFAKFMEAGAVEILESWDIAAGQTLLDVGCGSGQTAIPAAKKGVKVTGIDIADNLIRHARQRAKAAKLNARFDVGDAEDLPYGDNSFDVSISMIGAMFAPRPERVVSEFARVIKPGGKLYMANWTPASMPAQMFKCVSHVVPPSPGFIPPVLWGDEETVRQRLTDDFTDIRLTRRVYPQWHYPFNASELVNLFRTHFGPVKNAFESIDKHQQTELHNRLEQIYRDNSATHNDVLTVTGGEFLEVIAVRR
jgi:ubiquinone/menaquinone biosynthesis C-methylase UbiE